jgi:hypothetical protein
MLLISETALLPNPEAALLLLHPSGSRIAAHLGSRTSVIGGSRASAICYW